MSSTTEQIKERLSIVDVVGGYVKLEKSGGNFKAKCPFHNEKTPSFYISPARDTYHCFGCSRGGDIFSFVEEIEGIDFSGALKLLAERAGVELRMDDHRMRGERERLLAAMEEATRFYMKELEKMPYALEYLKGRGMSDATIAQFRIGFAPDGWRNLYDHLRSKNFSEQEMDKAGLVIFKNEASAAKYDRFRSRIMFPIADTSGRVIAFSGRIFLGRPASPLGGEAIPDSETGAGQAKYINSPETVLFNKSKTLYAYDHAKFDIRRSDECIIVEGQMDVVMSHQAGVANAVAASGTALTALHLEHIGRMTNHVTLAFDADDAGLKAAGRSIDLALEKGFTVSVIELRGGKDPADIIKSNPDAWRVMVQESKKHIVDFYLNTLVEKNLPNLELRRHIENIVLPRVLMLKDSDRGYFVPKIAFALGMNSEEPLWDVLRTLRNRSAAAHASQNESLSRPPLVADAEGENDRYICTIENALIGIILWQRRLAESAIDRAKVEAEFSRIYGSDFSKLADRLASEQSDPLIFQAEMQYAGRDSLARDIDELLDMYDEQRLKKLLHDAMVRLRLVESAGTADAARDVLAECQTISNKINQLVFKREQKHAV